MPLAKSVFLTAAILLGCLHFPGARAEETDAIRIGVLAYRGPEQAVKQWKGHAEYLAKQLAPRRFEIVPLSYSELTDMVRRRQIQLVITNTGHYTEMELTGGVSRIATRLMAGPTGTLDQFGGTVITRAQNRGINRYADIKGRILMVPDKSSLGGWQVHLREAIDQGVNLEKDARAIRETRNHEKVVEGVLAGDADVGFVRSDLVESMAKEGRIRLSDLHIVNPRQETGFPYLLSTRLYPEWPLARVAGVPEQLAKDVLIQLLALGPDHPAARAAGIQGWTLPHNYQSVHDLFREARLGPYANLPITLDDILGRYGLVLSVLLLTGILSLAGLAWYINGVNRSLKEQIRRRLEAEQSLEESDNQFRAMADALPSLIWQAGADKHCTFFNRSWLAFTGRSMEQELGQGWVEGVHPEDRASALATYERAFDAREPFEMKYRLHHASGEYRWIVDVGTPIHGPGGVFRGYFGHCLDITQIQHLNEALRSSNDRLATSLNSLRLHTRDLTQINEMSELLQACLKEEEIHRIFAHVARNLGLGRGGLLVVARPLGRGVQTVASWGDTTGMEEQFSLDDCWGARRGQAFETSPAQPSLSCNHYRADPSLRTLCQPLLIQGETLGLISIRDNADIDEADWQRIRQLSVNLGEALKLAISNIRLREALREQAMRDPLTGLFNRRYLDETLPRELHACLREDQPLALAILDLDHFKRYNDTWGHEAGDQVLIEVSRILREHLRASDIACRYGGEELVAVMPRAELHEARERLSRIAHLVRDAEIHIHDRPLPAVTFSAGIAIAPLHGNDAGTLMRAADQALYAAKQAGRDRLFTAGEGA